MAARIIAVVGRMTRAEAGRALNEDFSDWTLRKDDPRGEGRKIIGKRDRKRDAFTLACSSLADLERAGLLLGQEGYAQQVVVYVKHTAKPGRFRSELSEFRAFCTVDVQTGGGSLMARATASGPVIDVGAFVLALVSPVLGTTRSMRTVVMDESLVGLLGVGAQSGVGPGAFPPGHDSIAPFDLCITAAGRPVDSTEAPETVATALSSAPGVIASRVPEVSTDMSTLVPVNTAWTSPEGFLSDPPLETAVVRLWRDPAGRHLATATDGVRVLREYDISSVVNENLVSDLRPHRRVEVVGCTESDAYVVARLLTALAGAGIPVTAIDSGAAPLPEVVHTRMAALDAVNLDDNVERALWSVRTRREVLAQHSQDKVRAGLAGVGNYPVAETESVSVIVASARRNMVPSILRQVRSQNYSNAEIILGLHGYSRSDVVSAYPEAEDLLDQIVLLEISKEYMLGEALRQLSLAAGGELIAKMDDDDFYTEDHLADLVDARSYSGADLVGCKAEFVYLEEQGKTIQRRSNSERYGASVTGGSLLLSRDALRQAGGWSAVRTAEDRLLQEGIRRAGGSIYRSHGTNYLMSRGDGARGHTWTPGGAYFEEQAVREWPGIGYPGWRTSGSDA